MERGHNMRVNGEPQVVAEVLTAALAMVLLEVGVEGEAGEGAGESQPSAFVAI